MKLKDIQEGQTVTLDGGFSCVQAGPALIEQDAHGLFFKCDEGHHYIDGQEDKDLELIGIS